MRGSWSLFGGGVHCTLMDVEDRVVRVTKGAVCEGKDGQSMLVLCKSKAEFKVLYFEYLLVL